MHHYKNDAKAVLNIPETLSIQTPTTTSPKVVVIVLNWNGWLDTIECVESLLRSARVPNQIVIVDNGSVDDSVERICEWAEGFLVPEHLSQITLGWSYRPAPKPLAYAVFDSPLDSLAGTMPPETPIVIVRVGDNRGYAGGNNVGIRYALERFDADYVWILNNDTVVERHALDRKLSVAEHDPTIGIVGAKLLRYQEPAKIQALGGGTVNPSLGLDSQIGAGLDGSLATTEPIELEHVIGASLFVRVDAVRTVGLIDESYFLYREETDWCIKMRRSGWKLVCCPTAEVWHKQGSSIGYKSVLHDYYSVRNMLFLLHKHHPDEFLSAFLMIAFRSTAAKIARMQFRRLAFVAMAFRDFFVGVRGRTHTEEQLLANRDAALERKSH
ncbi:MAG TPA: glycosyltransferase family 2 protein [Candidatus Rubrimentiphilum sp.]|nr:glycosyltransferase family 2 protein [Candidatus Rubrimentiphilum sp.]